MSTLFEQNLLRMMQNPPPSVADFAKQFATNYDMNIAMTCIPTPITVGKRALFIQALIVAFGPPGFPPKAAAGIVQGLTVFWLGVPVLTGAVTAFLGGPALVASLAGALSNPKISNEMAAKIVTQCLKLATTQVQYTIPPAPPAFLMVPP